MGGLGYTMVALTFFFAIYYNVIIAYAIHYLFAGMASQLPWAASPPALSANGRNLHASWSSLNDGNNDTTCCYERLLDDFNLSNHTKVRLRLGEILDRLALSAICIDI